MIGKLELFNWITLFEHINEDIRNGVVDGYVVPLTDVEYYTHQIDNLTDEKDPERAERIAQAIADHIRNDNDSE